MFAGNLQRLRLFAFIVCCFATVTLANQQRIRYDNHKVFRLEPQTTRQLEILKQYDGQRKNFVFLDDIHVIVSPNKVQEFEIVLRATKIPYEIVEQDAQSTINLDDVAKEGKTSYDWTKYHTLNDTYEWLYSLVEKYPNEVSIFHAGRSYEGRDILGLKISYGNTMKKGIFLEGGIHACEWIGPAVVTYILNELLTSKDSEVRMIAENFDWYIVPHVNPDGFVYTHTTDRFWRKTRTPYGDDCLGADPNRNWDLHWNEAGAEEDPCSNKYAGPHAFSEIEVRTLSEYLEGLRGKLFLYVSFHSFSQLLLYPYGYKSELPKNYADIKRIYNAAVQAISKRHGTKFGGGNIYDAIYPASGSSIDWIYDTLGVKYAFCYELRPAPYSIGGIWYGYALPSKQIIPSGEETLDSLVSMVKEAGIIRYL